jgi:hypothetical protein
MKFEDISFVDMFLLLAISFLLFLLLVGAIYKWIKRSVEKENNIPTLDEEHEGYPLDRTKAERGN